VRKGRLDSPAADAAKRFSESVSFDRRLYRQDIAGSIAHASGLQAAGLISAAEFSEIESGLREIEKEIERGDFEWDTSLEDVHMNLEAALTKRIGKTGGKLHTARSRNDQVALDLRLYVRDEGRRIDGLTRKVQTVLIDCAEGLRDSVMPGYTHLQRAQPIPAAHYILAQVEALQRDRERLSDCLRRTDVLPLGSGALAGSTLVLDRELIAKRLGFSGISRNSVDAVSDRDFACEFLFCLAMVGLHLSRMSEDFVLWSTREFGFVQFSDAFATGSSLMPQKKNPDMAELTRGKTGRLYGNLISLLATLKGLPAAYNRDLQEDKEAVFDSVDTVTLALEVWAAMLPQITFDTERMAAAAHDSELFATDLAEYLVKKGLPFREAHEVVGRLVAQSAAERKSLNKLSPEQFKKISPLFESDVLEIFDAQRSIAKRTAVGAPGNVTNEISSWRKRLEAAI
jgi:argininosuccinate lyase